MTRTPPTPLHAFSDHLRTRIPAGLTRKTVAYAGAGLALAGVTGATAAAGFGGHPAAAATAQQSAISGASHRVTAAPVGHTAAKETPAGNSDSAKKAPATKAPAKKAPDTSDKSASKHAAPAKHNAPAKPAKHENHERTWAAVKKIVAKRTDPKPGNGALPAQDQLTPIGTSGPQSWLPMTQARWDNAKTIVHEAITKHMGLRAAVIAVATSMQESTLLNLNYGDRDSLGLFQQRPSCGWGSASQIEHPAYAAGAFLNALHDYQASNPGWAHEPLWQSAQGVQGSAFPSAYAKWEAQAAHLVLSVTKQLV